MPQNAANLRKERRSPARRARGRTTLVSNGVNTPWRTHDCRVILTAMNNKTWLMDVEFMAYAVAAATIAFTLMVGNALWKRMAR